MEKFYIEILGFFAVALGILMYQTNDRKKLIFCKLITDVLWIVHYMLLGGYTIVFTTSVAVFRELVFINKEKPIFKKPFWLWLFIFFYLMAPIITWKNIFSIFPGLSSVMSTIGFWCNDVKKTKILSFFVAISQMIYAISANSYATITNEILTMLSIAFSFIKKKFKKNQQSVKP